MPKVSVLMPVYNAGKYLSRAIDSIIHQTFKDWELILINDGSTDDSEEIITRYEEARIYYVKNETNLGLIKTLNKGIALCGGEYIARMDADDISHPERLKKQVDFLDKHPDYLMCGTNAAVIDNSGKKTGRIRNLTKNDFLQICLLFTPSFVHPSMMIRADVLRQNPYEVAYKHVEDYELWCRIAKQGKIANLKDELLEYRWHDTNVSVLNNEVQDKLKDKIISDELRHLDIIPTEDELYCHKITFQLYSLGNKQAINIERFDDILAWFTKLIRQNEMKDIYEQESFIAFLWSRWIVLCLSQKRYSKVIPSFASFSPSVIGKLLKLILFLKDK
ncbi:glycosyltransferase [Prevotella sp. 10(H)]|uniref:glycosyltransferase family 2 protein n=1 Tax=Prevotella sp. 10(H) TaxID=1158294 RepID=UPI0004A6D7D9|nr:glycosyltransferase [Prevotella sp. 10(H)]